MIKYIILFMSLITSCGSAQVSPAKFYASPEVPKARIKVIKRAFNSWNNALGKQIFIYTGRIDVALDRDDNFNVIYWVRGIGKNIVGRAHWTFSPIQCDIEVDSFNFGVPRQVGNNIIITDLGNDYLFSLLLHELGHCMVIDYRNINPKDRYHSPFSKDIMYFRAHIVRGPTFFDIIKAKKALGITPVGGVGGD